MLSETPVSMAICRGPALVFTRSISSGGNSECISRGRLSSLIFQSSLMSLALAGLRSFSSFCQLVRCGLLPSVSQSALRAPIAARESANTVDTTRINTPRSLLPLQPDVSYANFPGPLDLESNQAAFSERGGVIVYQDGHDMTID